MTTRREPPKWTHIEPSHRRRNVHIPDTFRERVNLHLFKNLSLPDIMVSAPLILGIQGPQGDGKSFQARETCLAFGVNVAVISGASLGGPHEGAPVEILTRIYRYASEQTELSQTPTILLIDDFDLSVAASYEHRETTVNTQLLTGFLMNLADNPRQCAGSETSRIPIIMTGNNFTALHGPLMREGRMDLYDWEPSVDEKVDVISAFLAPWMAADELPNLKTLVKRYERKPIAFFAALQNDYINALISDAAKVPLSRLTARDTEHVQANINLKMKERTLTVERLIALADARDVTRPTNYLTMAEADPVDLAPPVLPTFEQDQP